MAERAKLTRVTLDGRDPHTGKTIRRVNLWHDHGDRAKKRPGTDSAVVAVARHGQEALLVGRDGDACKIRVKDGRRFVEGWVTFWFVRELKEAWFEEQAKANVALEASDRAGAA